MGILDAHTDAIQDYKWLHFILPNRKKQVKKAMKETNKLPREWRKDLLKEYDSVYRDLINEAVSDEVGEIYLKVVAAIDQLYNEIEIRRKEGTLPNGDPAMIVTINMEKLKLRAQAKIVKEANAQST